MKHGQKLIVTILPSETTYMFAKMNLPQYDEPCHNIRDLLEKNKILEAEIEKLKSKVQTRTEMYDRQLTENSALRKDMKDILSALSEYIRYHHYFNIIISIFSLLYFSDKRKLSKVAQLLGRFLRKKI